MTNAATTDLTTAQRIDGTGAAHLVRPGRHIGRVTTFCTGRSLSWMVGTDAPVSCKACLAKASRDGIDPKGTA